MEYKAVSISPKTSKTEGVQKVAQDLEAVIQKYCDQGWAYVRVETLQTFVAGNAGCFGLGATPGYNLSMHVIVFQRESNEGTTASLN